MAQKRYLEYKNDDTTYDLNNKLVGLLNHGRFAGFDVMAFQPNMTLRLNHDVTGRRKIASNLTTVEKAGIVLTRQGVVVEEDGQLDFTIEPNATTKGRIDYIVLEHQHVEVTGGQAAIYKVLKGPVTGSTIGGDLGEIDDVDGEGGLPEPTLTDDKKQVVIGKLLIAPFTSALQGSASVWTPTPAPSLGDSEINAALEAVKSLMSSSFANLRLNDLLDVVMGTGVSAPAANNVLYFTGSSWRNRSFATWIQETRWKMKRAIEHGLVAAGEVGATVALTEVLRSYASASFPAKVFQLPVNGNKYWLYLDTVADAGYKTFESDAQVGTEWTICLVSGKLGFALNASGAVYLGEGETTNKNVPIKNGSLTGNWNPPLNKPFTVIKATDGWYIQSEAASRSLAEEEYVEENEEV